MVRAKKTVIAVISACILLCLAVVVVSATATYGGAHALNTQESYMSTGAPVADKPDGEYTGNLTVSLSSSLDGAEIYYTLDGSVPTAENGTKYASAVTLTPRKSEYIVRAVATAGGGLLNIAI